MASEKQKHTDLDKETLEQIVKELNKRRSQIIEDLELIAKDDETEEDGMKAKFPDFGSKSDENAQEISEYSTNLATEKVLQSTIRDIDSTLERIKKGTYGICKYCDKEINKKRLVARPVASACIECKTKLQNQI